MSKLTCVVFVLLGFVAISFAAPEPPRLFGRILNENPLFERQELPEEDYPDAPYPPAGNVPELPLAPPQEYGPPPQIPTEVPVVPATSYGVPIIPSQEYGPPADSAERIIVHPVPAKLSIRHIHKIPVHSERIILPSHAHHSHHLHHSEKLISSPHHLHAERIVLPAHHDSHFHSEKIVIPSIHNDLHAERIVLHGHPNGHLHSQRLVAPTHLHYESQPATVIRVRVSEN